MKILIPLHAWSRGLSAGLLAVGLVLPAAAQEQDELDWLLEAGEPSEAEDLDWLAEPADGEEPEVTAEPDVIVDPGVLEEPDLPEDVIDFSEGDVDPNARLERRVVEGTEQITISLDDVLLEDAVRMFAQTSGANIIASGTMLADRRVTVNLTDVDWRPALRSILEIHDLDLVERTAGSGIYSIRARVADAPAPSQVQTFFLDYTTVTEVQEAIGAMLNADAKLTVFASRNALVVRSTESNLSEVEALIRELDRPGRQVLIEARIMELSDDARKAVGIDWSVLEGYRVGITDASWGFQEGRTRSRTQEYRGRDYDEFDGETTRGTENSRTATRTATDQFGVPLSRTEWDTDNRTGLETEGYLDQSQRRWGTSGEALTERLAEQVYEDLKSAILAPADFSVLLSALQRTDGVSIVSNPKMIVTSGSTNAFFSVGFREPIIETEILRGNPTLGQADLVVSRLATGINTDFIKEGYLEEGIELRVVATVKTDDYIEADISPSLRRKIDEKIFGDNSWPILSVKEIDTSFTLRSGQTVAIGGLTGTEDTTITSRIPILGSIPLIGRLFRHERDGQAQTETIIFVTLSVADPDGLAEHAGIPEDARLVHNRRLLERARREEFMRDLRERQDAEDRAWAAREARDAEAETPVQPEEPATAGEDLSFAPAVRPREDQFSQPVPR